MKHRLCPRLLASLLAAFAALPAVAQTTGFNQAGAGPFDYNDTANWVATTINGVWNSDLTLTASQSVTFGADTTLSTGLNIGYAGNFDLNFLSDGTADRTLTLGGDLVIAPASNRTINFGSLSANQGLNVNLAGSRTFTVGSGKILNFFNTVSGGDFTVTGTSNTTAGGTVKFSRAAANAATSNITVANNATLQIDNSTNGNTGTTRAQSVTLASGGKLSIRGNNTNTVEVITGALAVDGGAARPRSSANTYHNVTVDAGSAHTLLQIGSLSRVNNGTLLVRGDNLGTNTIASATAGSSNIEITGAAPTMIGGGGAAGTTTQSIISWLVGGSTISDIGSTFVTYSAANGLRPLDTATEFASGFGGNATDNVRLTAITDTAIVGDATVNSLILAGSGGSVSGDGTLTVTSGAILLTRTSGSASNININLDFGSAQGIIGFARGDTINGAIAGTNGLAIHGNRNDEGLNLTNATSTYTGDTYVLSNVAVSGGFLPYGTRTGDVYVSGNLQLNASGYNGTINGLNGTGVVAYGNSGNSSLTLGDNDADGTFDGQINTNNKLLITKIGTGTQILNGQNSIAGTITVTSGTLLVNGTTGTATGAISVASGASFGGSGTTTGAVTVAAFDSVIIAGGVDSIGTLSLSSGLTANSGVTFAFDIDGASIDTIDFGTAALNLGGTVTFDFTNLDSVESGLTYSLFAGSGTWNSVSASFLINGPAGYELDTTYGGGNGYIFDDATNSFTVQFTAVPEPSAYAALAALAGLLVAANRRQRRSN